MEEEVLEHFQNNPTTRIRSAARALHLSRTTVWKVLVVNIRFVFSVCNN